MSGLTVGFEAPFSRRIHSAARSTIHDLGVKMSTEDSALSPDEFEACLRATYGGEAERLCWVGTLTSGYAVFAFPNSYLLALMSSDEFARTAYAYAVHRGRRFATEEEAARFGDSIPASSHE